MLPPPPPLAARSLSFRHWPASGGAFELLSASPACMSSSVLLRRRGERRARQQLVCWAPMPPPHPRCGKGEAGGARGISGSSLCRPPHAPGGAREACTSPVSPCASPCSCVRAERSPGRPPPRALYFPGWNRRGLPGRAGKPPLPGGDRVQRGARPREQGRAEALEPAHLAVSAKLALLPWARAGSAGRALAGRGFSLPLLRGLSN